MTLLYEFQCGRDSCPRNQAQDARATRVLLHRRFKFVFARLVAFTLVAAVKSHLAVTRARNGVALLVELHSKIQTHAAQNVADFAERFLAEILRGKHFSLRTLHEITNGLDAGVL